VDYGAPAIFVTRNLIIFLLTSAVGRAVPRLESAPDDSRERVTCAAPIASITHSGLCLKKKEGGKGRGEKSRGGSARGFSFAGSPISRPRINSNNELRIPLDRDREILEKSAKRTWPLFDGSRSSRLILGAFPSRFQRGTLTEIFISRARSRAETQIARRRVRVDTPAIKFEAKGEIIKIASQELSLASARLARARDIAGPSINLSLYTGAGTMTQEASIMRPSSLTDRRPVFSPRSLNYLASYHPRAASGC